MVSLIPDFVGHENLLQTIDTALQHHRRVVITGAQGMGKTTVAQAYAQQFGRRYRSVFWINAATEETLLADLLTMLPPSALPVHTSQRLFSLLQALQQDLFTQQDALIILENFPERKTLPDLDTLPASLVAAFPPRQLAGSVIVITQAADLPAALPCVKLTPLDAQEGALLVLRRSGLLAEHAELDQVAEEQRRAALELARELQGLPVALALAAGYLRATNSGIGAYLAAFREYATRTHLPASPGGDDLEAIVVACELLLTHLAEKQPEVLEPLQICALLLPEAIPISLFLQQANSFQTEDDAEAGERHGQEGEAIQTLLAYGLLTADDRSSTLRMPPLFQEVVRQFFALDNSRQHLMQALHLFQNLIPMLAVETPAICLRVAAQIHHLAQLSEQDACAFVDVSELETAVEVFDWAASLFWYVQLIEQAEFLLSKVLVLQERNVNTSAQALATTIGNLALLKGLLKRYVEAETLAQRAVESKVKALGINHPDVLLTLDHLGRVYAEQGKQREARLCYEKALSIADQVQLRRHPMSCLVRYHLALLHIDQEQFNEAASLLRRVCFFLERLPSAEQGSLLMEARFSLAEVYACLQNWEEAATCYRKALPLSERLLGEEHLVTLEHLEQAALVFLQQGNADEAERLLRRVLTVREQTPGTEPGALASCWNGLARVALAQEHIAEASALLERAQQLLSEQPESSTHAAVLDTLTALEGAQQRYEQAIAVSKQALEIRQRLEQKLTRRVENLDAIATLYLALGKSDDAERYLSQALVWYQQEGRPEDLALDCALTKLADIEVERGRVLQARMYLERVRAIRELAWGGGDPRTKEIVQRLAGLSFTGFASAFLDI
jgi:tetratricopeptide (TPR) repeat protein